MDPSLVLLRGWTDAAIWWGVFQLVGPDHILCGWVLLCQDGLPWRSWSSTAGRRLVGRHRYELILFFIVFFDFSHIYHVFGCASILIMFVFLWSRRRTCAPRRATLTHVESQSPRCCRVRAGASPGGEALGPTDRCHPDGRDRGHPSGWSATGHWGTEDLGSFVSESGTGCSMLQRGSWGASRRCPLGLGLGIVLDLHVYIFESLSCSNFVHRWYTGHTYFLIYIYIWRFYIQCHVYGVLYGLLMFLCFLVIFHVCDLMYLENVLYANLKQNLWVSLLTGFDV